MLVVQASGPAPASRSGLCAWLMIKMPCPRLKMKGRSENAAGHSNRRVSWDPEFPDEVYLLYQSGAVFHGSLSEEP